MDAGALLPLLLGGVALFAVSAVFRRRLLARARDAAWRAEPGRSPENPLRIETFGEIDAAMAALRCPCGGTVVPLSEASLARPEGTIRVAHGECLRCESDLHLYFDLEALRH
jgi:hypothetical protein